MRALVHPSALQRAQPWIAANLVVALGLTVGVVPAWGLGAVLALVALKALAARRRWRLSRRVVLPLAALALGAWLLWGTKLPAGGAVTTLFALALALKWLEASPQGGARDALLLLLAACVLAALGALYHVALLSMLLLVLQAALLGTALAALQGSAQPLRSALRLLGLALPLAALLFVFTPRVQGPLWDFGLALGLPIAASAPRSLGLGAREELEPGGQADARLENGTMLVARFEGYQPATAEMYWRGPVFWTFDGQRWTPRAGTTARAQRMARGYRRLADWAATFEPRGQPLHYSLRVAGHGGPWLYALDLPGSLPAESFLTDDGQLLSMTPLRAESSYRARAWRQWRARAPRLSASERQQALAYPAAQLPRLHALGREIAAAEGSHAARVARVLALFSPARFALDARAANGRGAAAYEHFLFEQRRGGAALFAASATLLLRAAGVPARLVSGFRGGRLMGSSGYVLVKQSHAHAWVEAWDDDLGWQRVDPLDGLRAPAPGDAPATSPTRLPTPAAAPASAAPAPVPTAQATAWWQALDGWLLHYDAARRQSLLDGLGEARLGVLRPLAWAALLAAALLLPFLLRRRWRARAAARDALAASWALLAQRLEAAGLPVSPTQCPSTLLAELRRSNAAWAAPAAELVEAWCALRYATPPIATSATSATSADAAQRALLRRVRRFRPQQFRAAAAPS